MAKKVRKDFDDDDELDDNLDDFQGESPNELDEDDDFNSESDSESDLDLVDDDIDVDIIIEINDEDLDINDKEEATEDEDIVLSKHKIDGKHSLKYDSIFKGKKEDPLNEDDMGGFSLYYKESIEVDILIIISNQLIMKIISELN